MQAKRSMGDLRDWDADRTCPPIIFGKQPESALATRVHVRVAVLGQPRQFEKKKLRGRQHKVRPDAEAQQTTTTKETSGSSCLFYDSDSPLLPHDRRGSIRVCCHPITTGDLFQSTSSPSQPPPSPQFPDKTLPHK